ncbi:MAG: Ig-like domain-containing protein, partial [Xanthomonadales bacterium]|nr:Ig-like domain-containing protein [Xanthomonadales bacterium]
MLTSPLAWGGAFSLTEQDIDGQGPQPDLVTHPAGYDGSGGQITVQVCIVPGSPDAGLLQVPVQNIVDRFNLLVPVSPNLRLGGANDIPANSVDFESVALHEVGHCLGLNHPNAATESGLADADQDYTKALPGNNGVFDVNDGSDNVIGSPDDRRGDDVNLHYFEIAVNNPFRVPAMVDAMTYSRDLDQLPGTDEFAANAARQVGASIYGVDNSEAVMQQGTFTDEVQRSLAADDVTTLRYARSGIDRLSGTGDDYTVQMVYGGISGSGACDINVSFNDAQTGFAVCQVSAGVSLADQAAVIISADAFFNGDFNWTFSQVRIPAPGPDITVVAPGGTTNRVNGDSTSLLDNDAHPSGLTLALSTEVFGAPEHGTVALFSDGSFEYTHAGDDAAEDHFIYAACVAGEPDSCAHQQVTISITASSNQQPTPEDDLFSVAEGDTFEADFSLLDNDDDPDGDPLALTLIPFTQPTSGTLELFADGRFTYQHDATEGASDSFVYEVCDDGDPVLCASAMVTVVIT